MFIPLLIAATATDNQQNIQSIIGVIGTSVASGGAITYAVEKIFDSKRIGQIVQLKGQIDNLEYKLTHASEELLETKKENAELKDQIEVLREQNNSTMNTRLIDLQEKHQSLMLSYRKAVKIIEKLQNKENQK